MAKIEQKFKSLNCEKPNSCLTLATLYFIFILYKIYTYYQQSYLLFYYMVKSQRKFIIKYWKLHINQKNYFLIEATFKFK